MADPSRTLRARIVKQVVTPLGIAEITLIDVPLDSRAWNKRESEQVESLARIAKAALDG